MRTCFHVGLALVCAFVLHTFSNRAPDPTERCTSVRTTNNSSGTHVTIQVGNIQLHSALADTGASKTVVPGCIMRTLADRGLAQHIGSTTLTMADDSVQRAQKWRTTVQVLFADNRVATITDHVVTSIEQPLYSALLGHPTLAALDLLVDPKHKKLVYRGDL